MAKLFTKRRLIWAGAFAGILLAALAGVAYHLSRRIEPFLREQTEAFLREKYRAAVEIGSLKISVPMRNPVVQLLTGGRGSYVFVRAENIVLRRGNENGLPPFMKIASVAFRARMAAIWNPPVEIEHLRLEGLAINIPPKRQRAGAARPRDPPRSAAPDKPPGVVIKVVDADGAVLVLHPKDPAKEPLQFTMRTLRLESAGPGIPMRYSTVLENPKPPGVVDCKGTFGPFQPDSPGESPVSGNYTFSKADLGVFRGIAGTLDSSGSFRGELDNIVVDGEARVPDFRMTRSGNRVPLQTKFHAIVDGTNGNTLLQPVTATLGKSRIVCRGGVVRNRGQNGKTVALDVTANGADLQDFLRLVLKGGRPPMTGGISLKIKLAVPPGKGDYKDRLAIAGTFALAAARFASPVVQEKIDDLSRRARGRPRAEEIEDVASNFAGRLDLRNGLLRLNDLTFAVNGADVALNGTYDLNTDALDFRGVARTRARLSQMVKSRWKSLVLKPVDPFFAKDGAGGVFRIAIGGTRAEPRFGRDRGKPDGPSGADR